MMQKHTQHHMRGGTAPCSLITRPYKVKAPHFPRHNLQAGAVMVLSCAVQPGRPPPSVRTMPSVVASQTGGYKELLKAVSRSLESRQPLRSALCGRRGGRRRRIWAVHLRLRNPVVQRQLEDELRRPFAAPRHHQGARIISMAGTIAAALVDDFGSCIPRHRQALFTVTLVDHRVFGSGVRRCST